MFLDQRELQSILYGKPNLPGYYQFYVTAFTQEVLVFNLMENNFWYYTIHFRSNKL